MKKLKLRTETVRALTLDVADLAGAAGGQRTNLTCQGGCQTIGCRTHHVSEVAHCTIRTL